ncbi:hypothetical protein ElyMa_000100200 [Elysia marginata]|uniref:Uncharacterized protein n=1 Tax=Elysia marginata TaxID=1093978 RepID=A0AAV4EKK2_9GAST|nr:hypothetical protein ElyMa_000100200 [Elysia marginata]
MYHMPFYISLPLKAGRPRAERRPCSQGSRSHPTSQCSIPAWHRPIRSRYPQGEEEHYNIQKSNRPISRLEGSSRFDDGQSDGAEKFARLASHWLSPNTLN